MKVIIQKADLDTCLTGLILGVGSGDEVIGVRGDASPEDLDDPEVLCIEAGGSGRVDLNNFDHHETDEYLPPACRQAFEHKGIKNEGLSRLVDYVAMVDEAVNEHPAITFPSLSSLFSGMLFVESEPLGQFRCGVALLQRVLDDHIDPFSTMPEYQAWHPYIKAKKENQKRLQIMLEASEFL